jgi:hypothetical protein
MKRAKAEPKYTKPKIVTKRSIVDLIDIYAPPISLLCKLGSIVVHVEEGSSANGHAYDWTAVRSLLADREVQDWIEAMAAKGFVPVKREPK